MNANQPPTRIAILGSWPDGLSTLPEGHAGKWEPWFRSGTKPPWQIWQSVESEIRAVIKRYGFLNIYIYYGDKQPVEFVARIRDLAVSPKPIAPPGPHLGEAANYHVWLQYQSVKQLRRKIDRDQFRELPYAAGQISQTPQPISQAAWQLMHFTGLLFIVDPGV
jgi:hypothetical protein